LDKNIIDSLKSLHGLSKAINSTLNIDEVVELVLEKTSKLMGADKVLILCLEKNENILNIYSSFGFEKGEFWVDKFYNVSSFDHCIVHKGKVITLSEVLPEADYREFLKTMPFLSDMLFAPLEIKGEAVGLLGVLNHSREFSQMELEIFCSLGSQVAIAMENANLYKKLKAAFLHTSEALAEAINSRDPYTGGHVRRVVYYSIKLADEIDLTDKEKENLRLSAILHDIGKIGIDDAILRKGGDLSFEEELKMRKHPDIGAKILGFAGEMKDVIPGVRHHHERFNGSGYPDGIKGRDIPVQARIIAITDAYDALTTKRPYRGAIEKDAALEKLRKSAGTQFDPFLVEKFCEIMKRNSASGKDKYHPPQKIKGSDSANS